MVIKAVWSSAFLSYICFKLGKASRKVSAVPAMHLKIFLHAYTEIILKARKVNALPNILPCLQGLAGQ